MFTCAAVEDGPRAPRPARDLAAAFAPEHVDEERDREEEGDPREQEERRQRPLELQDVDDPRDQEDHEEPAKRPIHVREPASHRLRR
jgi:hypothetical protein